MDTISGFALSQEELLAALLIADLPLLIGFDDLENRIFNELNDNMKIVLMAAAERSLIAHGMVTIDESSTLDENVKNILQTCGQPKQTWMMLHQPASQSERASYFHQNSDHITVAHIETAGIHQFIQLSNRQDIIDAAIQLVSPVDTLITKDMSGKLEESFFAALAESSSRPTKNKLQTQLKEFGFNSTIAQAFARTFEELTSITAFARFSYAPKAEIQRAFTVVCGENGQWILTLDSPNRLHVQGLDKQSAKQVLHDFGRMVVS